MVRNRFGLVCTQLYCLICQLIATCVYLVYTCVYLVHTSSIHALDKHKYYLCLSIVYSQLRVYLVYTYVYLCLSSVYLCAYTCVYLCLSSVYLCMPVFIQIGPIRLSLVDLTAGWQGGRQTVRRKSCCFRNFQNPDVSLGFLNRFLALVRLYQYIYGQFL